MMWYCHLMPARRCDGPVRESFCAILSAEPVSAGLALLVLYYVVVGDGGDGHLRPMMFY